MERIINAGGFVEFGRVNGASLFCIYIANDYYDDILTRTIYIFFSYVLFSVSSPSSRQFGSFSRNR